MYIDSRDNACSLSYRMQNNYRYLVRNSVCYHYNVPNYVRHANNAVIYLPSRVWRRIPMVRLATVSLDILGKVTSSIPRLWHSSTSMWCVSSLSVATTHNPDPESKKKKTRYQIDWKNKILFRVQVHYLMLQMQRVVFPPIMTYMDFDPESGPLSTNVRRDNVLLTSFRVRLLQDLGAWVRLVTGKASTLALLLLLLHNKTIYRIEFILMSVIKSS